LRLLVSAQEMPAITRGLPSMRPRTKVGKDFGLAIALITSTKATVAFLSASGSAANIGSSAAGPPSFSFAMAFCVAGLWGSLEDLISVMSRSARRLVKKPIQPFRQGTCVGFRYPGSGGKYAIRPCAAGHARHYNRPPYDHPPGGRAP